jgi:NAD(P)-dependent dehydrogenase (short-subunit alcohol dehydrogenase family)
MSVIFITGSTDGLGRMAAERLVAQGHDVVLHGRNEARAVDALDAVPGARCALIGDLSSIEETRTLAEQANRIGRFDAVIHNAGVGYREPRIDTVDGLEHVFAVNVLAPYLLTALVHKPARLVYLSSALHRDGDLEIDDLQWTRRTWNPRQAYADSKLMDTVLALAVARLWPDVYANALEPGWVPTKMGGPNAPGDLDAAPETPMWLATSDHPRAAVTGQYFFDRRQREHHRAAGDPGVQDALLGACEALTGVALPRTDR